jgi:hypothetical protein
MTPSELISEAVQKGLVLTLEGESIRVRGPHQTDAEVSALIEEIRTRKPEIVQALKSSGDATYGAIIAVLICSEVLEDYVWLAMADSFDPGDGLAVYWPAELEFLATKDPETLREIQRVKLAFGGGRVRQ